MMQALVECGKEFGFLYILLEGFSYDPVCILKTSLCLPFGEWIFADEE